MSTAIHLPVRTGSAELARLRAIETAAVEFVAHVAGRERCGDSTVRASAAHTLRDAVHGTTGGEAS